LEEMAKIGTGEMFIFHRKGHDLLVQGAYGLPPSLRRPPGVYVLIVLQRGRIPFVVQLLIGQVDLGHLPVALTDGIGILTGGAVRVVD
jgi:hypothetical protein